MSRSNWNFFLTFVGSALAATIIWVALQPSEPRLTGNEQLQTQKADYRAGGSNCDPAALDRLSGEGATSRRERCSEASEQHRLQINDLIQQTRAANAAQASVALSYKQSWMMLAGTILGVFTLFAAAFAAFFAKRAADHTKTGAEAAEDGAKGAARAAKAAEDALADSRHMANSEFRPWLDLVIEIEKPALFVRGKFRVELKITVKNSGRTPAFHVIVRMLMFPIQKSQKTLHFLTAKNSVEALLRNDRYYSMVGGNSVGTGHDPVLNRNFLIPHDKWDQAVGAAKAVKGGTIKIACIVNCHYSFGDLRHLAQVQLEIVAKGKKGIPLDTQILQPEGMEIIILKRELV